MSKKLAIRIKKLREKLGLSQQEFADIIGIHLQSISRWERGTIVPSVEAIATIAEEFGADPLWLLMGEGSMFKNARYTEDLKTIKVTCPEQETRPFEAGDTELVGVPLFEGEVAAGKAGGFYDRPPKDALWLPEEIVGQPYEKSAIRVSGNSMYPTLWNNDIVIVDHTVRFEELRKLVGKIVVLRDAETCSPAVKRLYIVESKNGSKRRIIAIEGKSDNPEHPDLYITGEDIENAVIGKVVLSLRRWGNK